MDLEAILRYLHFVGIFAFVGGLTSEHLLIKPQMSRREIRRLFVIDMVYGLGALLVVGAGLYMWLAGSKNADFYTSNGLFHIKLTLFVIMVLLSTKPTLYFFKQRKGDPEEVIDVPKSLKMIMRVELLILFIIPLLAVLVARGVQMGGG